MLNFLRYAFVILESHEIQNRKQKKTYRRAKDLVKIHEVC